MIVVAVVAMMDGLCAILSAQLRAIGRPLPGNKIK